MFKRGFTLIELLVVIAIIGVLSSVVLASLNTARARARDAKRKADVRAVYTAMGLYYSNHGDYTNISYGGTCGTALNGADVVSVGLSGDNIIKVMPVVPSVSGTCGDNYYAGTWNTGQSFAVLTRLENPDSNCTAWSGGGWYLTGSYCNGYFIQVWQ